MAQLADHLGQGHVGLQVGLGLGQLVQKSRFLGRVHLPDGRSQKFQPAGVAVQNGIGPAQAVAFSKKVGRELLAGQLQKVAIA